jgi:hypothetical protein
MSLAVDVVKICTTRPRDGPAVWGVGARFTGRGFERHAHTAAVCPRQRVCALSVFAVQTGAWGLLAKSLMSDIGANAVAMAHERVWRETHGAASRRDYRSRSTRVNGAQDGLITGHSRSFRFRSAKVFFLGAARLIGERVLTERALGIVVQQPLNRAPCPTLPTIPSTA